VPSRMYNPETQAMIGTRDTERRLTRKQIQHRILKRLIDTDNTNNPGCILVLTKC